MVSTPTKPGAKRWVPKAGDRVLLSINDVQGTLAEIDKTQAEPYLVQFDNGRNERFSKADFKKWIEFVNEPLTVVTTAPEIPRDSSGAKYKVGDRIVAGSSKDGYIQEVIFYRGVDTYYEVLWWNGQKGSYTEKQIEKYGYEVQTLLSEEELTPTDENAIGRHYWFDQNTVAVTVLSCQYWKKNSKGKPTAIGRVRPWWTHEGGERSHPDQFAVEFSQLVEIEEFSCPNPKFLETPESQQVGSLYQYTSNKADKKTGTIRTFPPVEGERKREVDEHWYWGFSYIEKSLGKRRDKSAAVPRSKLAAVRAAIRDRKSYQYILQTILGKD